MITVGETRETTKTSILVVDDLPEKHLAYEAMLEDLGSNIVSVRSGADALKQILPARFCCDPARRQHAGDGRIRNSTTDSSAKAVGVDADYLSDGLCGRSKNSPGLCDGSG